MGPRTAFAVAVLAGGILLSDHALAFTVDEKSGTNPDGSARYVDPDEQPLPFLRFGGGAQTDNNDSDRSSGDGYSTPASGAHQWPNLFDWLLSTPPPRK
jgi:hypothetical protein